MALFLVNFAFGVCSWTMKYKENIMFSYDFTMKFGFITRTVADNCIEKTLTIKYFATKPFETDEYPWMS